MTRIIQISELTFSTRDRRRILENLYFSVERGEVVGIVGEPNAGKTLLLELLQGEVKPQGGQILVNDRNVTRLGRDKLLQLRQHLGVVPQSPFWPRQLSVEACIQFKLSWLGLSPQQTQRKTDEVIQSLGLGSLRGEKFPDLGLLEQRTVYLALALCHEPVLLLCDDVFEGLGEEGESTLTVVLNRVHDQRNLTTLLTGQRPEPLARLNGRITTLEGGILREAG